MRAVCYLASYVLPVTCPPIVDGGVLVGGDGRIAAVGPGSGLPTGDDVAVVDLGSAILLPGLINVHVHADLAAFRGLFEDLPFHLWIPSLRRCRLAASATADELRASALLTCAESLAAGITTFAATEDSAAAVHALGESGMRGVVYREVFGPDPAQAETAARELSERVFALQASAGERVRVGLSPHAPYTVSDALYARVAQLARREHWPVAVHAGEAEAEEQLG